MTEDFFQESETWVKYEHSVISDERGSYYQVEIKELHISGHQFESWPFEFGSMLESKIVDALIEDYGVPYPNMQMVVA